MSWTTPRTWTADELVTATMMNTHIRDNLNALKSPPSDNYECDEASDYTTTSTSFVDVDGTNLELTITTNGGAVLVHFHGMFYTNGARLWLDVDVDETREGGDDGIIGAWQTANFAVTFSRLITGLSAGEHTFTLQWKVASSGTATLYAGAGTSNADMHPQFWVREVS
jgi:hypothetical protein